MQRFNPVKKRFGVIGTFKTEMYDSWVSLMLISDVIPDDRSLMFLKRQNVDTSAACIADIICIAQITLEMINNALVI